MRIVAIVQARMGSSRLPGKMLKKIVGKTVIEILLTRLKKSKFINEIIVATSVKCENDPLVNEVERLGFNCFRGSELDVLDRFYHTSIQENADVIVRITGDCPVVDYRVIDEVIKVSSLTLITYQILILHIPRRIGRRSFTKASLSAAQFNATFDFDREHVTPFIRNGNFKKINYCNDENLADFRLTLDELEDLNLLIDIFEHFSPDIHFSYLGAIDYLREHPQKISINNHLKRNEGASMGSGQKLWKRAKKVIPGGNMLLSKRSEMHLPENWPSYFSKTSGCSVWDIDGKHYYDYHLMGVGTNLLGYSHPEVDAVVMDVIKSGNMSTLNAPEEVLLAEKLIDLDPWAGMVRFARSGGEANAIAIRIGRAATGRDGVAVCGYHGWHDWYLSANLSDEDQLAGHLLPGLSTNGVPKSLKKCAPFNYNDFDALENLVFTKSIGVIKMEVIRNLSPKMTSS